MSKIAAIHWTVIGGTPESPHEKTTKITWDETLEGLIQINLSFIDGTTATGLIYASKAIIGGGGQNAQNSISFDYDSAGNQKRRKMIYLRRQIRHHLSPDPTSSFLEDIALIPSDEYDNISYYPNPVKSELYVHWTDKIGEDMVKIEMYDVTGKLIRAYPDQTANDQATINFEMYPSGIYEVKLLYAGGQNKTLKIVKQ